MWYAHNTSGDDSFMLRKSLGIADLPRDSTAYNQRRLVNYLEGNIDFPLDIASDPVKLFIKHRSVFLVLLIFILMLNLGASFIGINHIPEEIETVGELNRSHNTYYTKVFLDLLFSIDFMVYLTVSLTGFMAY